MIWDRDARYTYYAHGPLKRLELGEDHVQGLDYTYTLQGWLKAVNHPGTVATDDPGQDGSTTTGTGTDAYGMALHYYSGDYVTNATSFNYQSAQLQPVPTAQGLYNGNIRSWANATATHFLPGNNSVPIVLPTGPEGGAPPVQKDLTADAYTYDELNRLRSSSMYTNSSNSTWQATSNYGTSYSYDANGNLLTLHRDGLDNAQLQMDRLDYTYTPGTNRLAQVEDTTPDEPLYGGQDLTEGIHSYSYDDIGNLTVDAEAGTVVSWNVYGKVKQVVNAAKGMTVSYSYDPAGQRIGKRVAKTVNQTITTLNTYYVRDAQGNVFATYERSSVQNAGQNTATAGPLTLVEQPIYGSQRLGIRQLHLALGTSTATPGYYARQLGQKHYELSDHLGNVRAVVSDKLLSSGGTLVPELTAYYNYFAFGMLQPGHFAPGNTTAQGGYRYGFNGQEKSDEISSGQFSAEFWNYDSRTARRWELDPISKPWHSNYSVLSNSPIWKVDPDGADDIFSANGNFVRHINNKTNYIMIEQQSGNLVRLDQINGEDKWFTSIDDNNRQTMANVVKYYATKTGFYGRAGVMEVPDTDKPELAHYDPDDKGIWVALKNGHVNSQLSDYYILMNAMEHEKFHRDDDAKKIGTSFTVHASVYTRQMQTDNFANLDESYQLGTAINMLDYLQTAKNQNEKGWMDVLNEFNATNRGGIRLQAQDSGGIRIFDKRGNELTTPLSKDWPQKTPD